jgi:hypothetical protein
VKVALILCVGIAFAQDRPERVVVTQDAVVHWRENPCEGFGPGDCSVRQPQTANVRVEFADREPARLLVRCRTKGCAADLAEVAEWVKRARDSK